MGFELGTDGPSTILVGVDGSPTSLRAAAYAAGLARRQRTRLVMVYARRPRSALVFLADNVGLATKAALEAEDQIEAQLRAVLPAQVAAWAVDAKLIVRPGDPLQVLSDVAREVGADAVIVGSSACAGHRVAGSLGIRLVRARRWPVTVVP